MVRAACSGKQNIPEGSPASGTSKQTGLKLASKARASLCELLEDYLDYMRLHHIQEWPTCRRKGDKRDPKDSND